MKDTKIERELAEANQIIRNLIAAHNADSCDALKKLEAAQERIRRLEEAGDAMFRQFQHPSMQTHQWTKAKEAKP
jgi:hypothetical protein